MDRLARLGITHTPLHTQQPRRGNDQGNEGGSPQVPQVESPPQIMSALAQWSADRGDGASEAAAIDAALETLAQRSSSQTAPEVASAVKVATQPTQSAPAAPAEDGATDPAPASAPLQCAACQETFSSRNKLFQHLAVSDACLDADVQVAVHKPAGPTLVRHNQELDDYYRGQQICDPAQWARAYEMLQQPLPITLRLPKSSSLAAYAQQLLNNQTEGSAITPILNGVANGWLLASDATPRQRQLVATLQELGAVQRQELSSMLPPLCLGPLHADHLILDLCCAPGSKTMALLDQMHESDEHLPSGMIIANDVSRPRVVTTAQRARRQPRQPLCLLNSDARKLPRLTG